MTRPKTVYLETMGCQMNALDSELVFGELLARGYAPTDDLNSASLVVLNTCSVRQHAEDKVYSRLGQLKHTAKRHPDRIVAVIGCMAERDGDGLLDKSPIVNILCGPGELHRLPALLDDVQSSRDRAVALSGRLRDRSTPVRAADGHDDLETLDSGRAFESAVHAHMPRALGRRQAYVRITRGCNKHCTFCVVPYTRGPEQHRPPSQIVDEVKRLSDAGVLEVTLLGQTVNHYEWLNDGRGQGSGVRFQGLQSGPISWVETAQDAELRSQDSGLNAAPASRTPQAASLILPPDPDTNFAQLLRRVHDEVPQLPRLRFVTSYPRDFTDEALRVMADSPRICRYLHIPAQSGSNAVLKRMNRGYTVEQYKALIDRARDLMPDIALAGDMIVGFCGETDDDFSASCDLLRFCRYKNCFIFKYSPRPGTPADDRLADDVPDLVKRQRNNDLLAIQAEVNMANHREMIGRVVEVLVEGPSKSAIKAQESEQERGQEIDHAALDRLSAGDPTATGRTAPGGDSPTAARPSLRGQLVGRTRGDQIVVFDGRSEHIGSLANVEVTAITPYTLHGRLAGDGPDAVHPPHPHPAIHSTDKSIPLAILGAH